MFANNEALVAHQRQSLDTCKLECRSSNLKEGIDAGEWERIEQILRKKRGGKGKSDYEKWFEIWQVLFPKTARPDTPCKDTFSLPRFSRLTDERE